MFSHSRRFHEQPVVGVLPGPGAYDPKLSDQDQHKRFGFLEKSDRFASPQIDNVALAAEPSGLNGSPEPDGAASMRSSVSERIGMMKHRDEDASKWKREAERWQDVNARLSLAAGKEATIQKTSIDALSKQLKSDKAEKASLQSQNSHKDKELQGLQKEMTALKLNYDKSQKQSTNLVSANVKSSQMTRKADELEKVNAKYKAQLDLINGKNKDLLIENARIQELELAKSKIQSDLSQTKQKLVAMQELYQSKDKVHLKKTMDFEMMLSNAKGSISSIEAEKVLLSAESENAKLELKTLDIKSKQMIQNNESELMEEKTKLSNALAGKAEVESQVLDVQVKYSQEIEDNMKKFTQLKARCGELVEANERLLVDVANMDAHREELESTVQALYSNLKSMKTQSATLSQTSEGYSEHIQDLESELQEKTEALLMERRLANELHDQVKEMKGRMCGIEDELMDAKDQKDSAIQLRDALQADVLDFQDALQRIEAQKEDIMITFKDQVATLEKKLSDVETAGRSRIKELSEEYETSAAKLQEDFGQQTKTFESLKESLSVKLAEAERGCGAYKDICVSLESDKSRLIKDNETLTLNLASSTQTRDEKMDKLRSSLERSQKEFMATLQEKTKALCTLEEEIRNLSQSHCKINSEFALLTETFRLKEAESQGFSSELVILRLEKAQHENMIQDLVLLQEQIQQELDTVQTTYAACLTDKSKVETQSGKELSGLRQQVVDKDSKAKKFEETIANIESVRKEEKLYFKQKTTALQKVVHSYETQLLERQSKTKLMEETVVVLKKELHHRQCRVDELEADLRGAQGQTLESLRGVNEGNQRFEKGMKEMQGRLESLNRTLDLERVEKEGVKKDLSETIQEREDMESGIKKMRDQMERQKLVLGEKVKYIQSLTDALEIKDHEQVNKEHRLLDLEAENKKLVTKQREVEGEFIKVEEYKTELKKLNKVVGETDDRVRILSRQRDEEQSVVDKQLKKLEAYVVEARTESETYLNQMMQLEAQVEKMETIEQEYICTIEFLKSSSTLAEHEMKQVAKDNASLLSHNNHKQKIRHINQLKEDNMKLKKDNLILSKSRDELRRKTMHLERDVESFKALSRSGIKKPRVVRAALCEIAFDENFIPM